MCQEERQHDPVRQALRERDAEALEAYRQSGCLTTRVLQAALLAQNHYEASEPRRAFPIPVVPIDDARRITDAVNRLSALVKVFEGAIWYLGGLQGRVNANAHRGLSGQGDGWSILVYSCAGRCLLALRATASAQSLTLITADDEEPFYRQQWGNLSMGPMGIQSLESTEATGRWLLEQAIRAFPELRGDDKVGIL